MGNSGYISVVFRGSRTSYFRFCGLKGNEFVNLVKEGPTKASVVEFGASSKVQYPNIEVMSTIGSIIDGTPVDTENKKNQGRHRSNWLTADIHTFLCRCLTSREKKRVSCWTITLLCEDWGLSGSRVLFSKPI